MTGIKLTDYTYAIKWQIESYEVEFENRNFFEMNWIETGSKSLFYTLSIPALNLKNQGILETFLILEANYEFEVQMSSLAEVQENPQFQIESRHIDENKQLIQVKVNSQWPKWE